MEPPQNAIPMIYMSMMKGTAAGFYDLPPTTVDFHYSVSALRKTFTISEIRE